MKKIFILPAVCVIAISLFACAGKPQTPTQVPTNVPSAPLATSTPTEIPATPTEVPATPTPAYLTDLPSDSTGKSVFIDEANDRLFYAHRMSVNLVEGLKEGSEFSTELASFADLDREGASFVCIEGLKDYNTLVVSCWFDQTEDSPYYNLGAYYTLDFYYIDIKKGERTLAKAGEMHPSLVLNDDYTTAGHWAISDTGIKGQLDGPPIVLKNHLLVRNECSWANYKLEVYDLNSIYNRIDLEKNIYFEETLPDVEPVSVLPYNVCAYDVYADHLLGKDQLFVITAEEFHGDAPDINLDRNLDLNYKNIRLIILDEELNELSSFKISDAAWSPDLFVDGENDRVFVSDGETVYVYNCKTAELKTLAKFKHKTGLWGIALYGLKDENTLCVCRDFFHHFEEDNPDVREEFLINTNTGEILKVNYGEAWDLAHSNESNEIIYQHPYLNSCLIWDKDTHELYKGVDGERTVKIEIEPEAGLEYTTPPYYVDWENKVYITSCALNTKEPFLVYSCYDLRTGELLSHCVISAFEMEAALDENNSKLIILGQGSGLYVWEYLWGLALPIVFE